MRLVAILPATALLAVLSPTCSLWPRVVVRPSYVSLSPGGRQQFTAQVSRDPSLEAYWQVSGPGSIASDGVYIAPHRLEHATIATVEARRPLKDPPREASGRALVSLEAGVAADPDTCAGVTQGTAPAHGEYVYADELPVAVTKVPPTYPDVARESRVDGTVVVDVLVCRSGRVVDVVVVKSIPMLDAAAVGAVRQWVFTPALRAGEPIAVWVAIPVRFSLH